MGSGGKWRGHRREGRLLAKTTLGGFPKSCAKRQWREKFFFFFLAGGGGGGGGGFCPHDHQSEIES